MEDENPTRYHVQRREFLSQHPAVAEYIIGIVEDTRNIPDEDEESWKSGRMYLEISDGYRYVVFNLGMSDREDRAYTLRQINLIAEVVNEVRDAVQLEVESRAARPHILYLAEAAVA